VFVDSTRAFDKSCSSMFSIAGRCLRIFRARSTNGFSFERDAQANQSSSRWQPWAPSIRVCPGTPGEDAGVWTLFGSLATAPGDHDSAESRILMPEELDLVRRRWYQAEENRQVRVPAR